MLLEGPASASSGDEPKTAILQSPEFAMRVASGEANTEMFRNLSASTINGSDSIAVLPFTNISADVENEYFATVLPKICSTLFPRSTVSRSRPERRPFSSRERASGINEIGESWR
ncbi:MAG: hypothetical protein IPG58_16450 [Acidobacteria bacterium]|nr:hypothetical protein [Acidobacteriota bacterium]